MKRLGYLLGLTLVSVCATRAQNPLPADSGHFIINRGNHPVGRSDFSIQPVKQGSISTAGAYNVTSHGNLSIEKTKYSFSGDGSLDSSLAILRENLNGIVNGSAVTFGVHSVGNNFAIDISADGRRYRNSLNRPPFTIFFPDFDLASYEILLSLTAQHAGAAMWALIPKQSGILSAATLAPEADVQGTLNGQSLTLHHTSLTIGSVVSELYYSGTNRILEVDIPGQTFAVVRENFQLQQPPPPPPQDAPNAQQPGAGAAPTQPQ